MTLAFAKPSQSAALPPELDLTPRARRPIALADETVAGAMAYRVPLYNGALATPLLSIIIVTYNNAAFTRLCMASLLAHTVSPFEVVIIDNASSDETRPFLQDAAERDPRVKLIFNDTNRGFAAANNQGLAAAGASSLVLLNNDTILTPAWDRRLVHHLADEHIGIICPTTNRIGNEAEIETSYQSYGQMLTFAATRRGGLSDIPTACMFCLAMRRDTFDRVGALDERFITGMFEDDDYSMRARAAGLRVVCAEDVFVHHFGQASFGKLAPSGEYATLFEANQARFEAKWSIAWRPHSRRDSSSYQYVLDHIAALAKDIPVDARVVVISKGDPALLAIGREARHFPTDERGHYRGYHPADDAEAVALLAGGDFLIVPAPAAWWLEHYRGLRRHLDGRLLTDMPGVGTVFDLRGAT